MAHRRAKLTVFGRQLLVDRVETEGWTIARAAEAAGVTRQTATKWVRRYRDEGLDGLEDRTSRPHHSPRALEPGVVGAILLARHELSVGPHRLSPLLQATVSSFGDEVRRIVDGCTDADEDPKPPWFERKQAYLARLATEDRAILLVSASDKLHNARSIVRDLRAHGDELWSRFSAPRECTLWYYRSLVTTYQHNPDHTPALVDELDRTVSEMEALAGLHAETEGSLNTRRVPRVQRHAITSAGQSARTERLGARAPFRAPRFPLKNRDRLAGSYGPGVAGGLRRLASRLGMRRFCTAA